MRCRQWVASSFVCVLLLIGGKTLAFAEAAPPAAAPATKSTLESPFKRIRACLEQGREFVLSIAPEGECKNRRDGEKAIDNNKLAYRDQIPFADDIDAICEDPKNKHRILGGQAIKQLIDEKGTIPPSGIRILGAIFCDELDLQGLDLKYSLVIDRSIFKKGIDARNIRVAADLSFDNSIVFDEFNLRRSTIGGSVYATSGFFEKLDVSDSDIKGTWHFGQSVVLKLANFSGAKIGGDFEFDHTAVSSFLFQSGSVGGELNFTRSEARCAYVLRATSIGRVTAQQVGFGLIENFEKAGGYLWWSRAFLQPPPSDDNPKNKAPNEILASRAIKKTLDRFESEIRGRTAKDSGCADRATPEAPKFAVLDTTIQGRFCLSSFAWLRPRYPINDSFPRTVIALNSTRVAGSTAIDLRGGAFEGKDLNGPDKHNREPLREKRRLETIGLTTGRLVFNFNDDPQMPYGIWLDGLNFERVAKNSERYDCQTQVKDLKDTLPGSQEVINWLEQNDAPSSQPFKAFVDAFERAGADATDLRVNRKTCDLKKHTCQLFRFFTFICGETKKTDEPTTRASTLAGPFIWLADVVTVGFQWGLLLLADHGLRPAKAIWGVLVVILAFLGWFWFWLRIGGFEPRSDDKTASATVKPNGKRTAAAPTPPPAPAPPRIWPINLLFLFDRLIPVYRIREEHYKIARYYRRASTTEASQRTMAGAPLYPMTTFFRTVMVYPATDEEKDRAERYLAFLRIIGVALAVFLVAAINALTRG